MSCRCAVTSRAPAERTRERTRRSPATKSIRSPAREARAASSRAASIAESSRGTSSTRPAEVREVSSTSTTRRSRSGCQVRTTTLRGARAGPPVDRPDVVAADVLAQRVELRPRPAHPDRGPAVELAQPGQPAGQVLAGLERRQRPHHAGDVERALAGGQPERPAGPHRHAERREVAAAPRAQRRGAAGRGHRGDRSTRCRLPVAPAEGCQASRTSARTRRLPGLATRSTRLGGVAEPHDADRVPGEGQRRRPRGEEQVDRPRAPPRRAATARPCWRLGRATTGTSPRRSSSGTRPVMTMAVWRLVSGGRGRSRGPRPAPRPRRRPRARPRGAARGGGPGSRGPAP